jgi:hypothetical protein
MCYGYSPGTSSFIPWQTHRRRIVCFSLHRLELHERTGCVSTSFIDLLGRDLAAKVVAKNMFTMSLSYQPDSLDMGVTVTACYCMWRGTAPCSRERLGHEPSNGAPCISLLLRTYSYLFDHVFVLIEQSYGPSAPTRQTVTAT